MPLDTAKAPLSRAEFYIACLTLCVLFSASMSSGYRTFSRNQKVGGTPGSKHCEGFAFDLVPDNPDDYARMKAAANGLGFDAVIEGDHLHVEHDPK